MRRLKYILMEYLTMFFIGGLFYYATEVIYRGYSHYTMFFAGGLIFILIGLENQKIRWEWALTSQMLVACITITVCELLCGFIVNICIGMNVWDYSMKPYNFAGQICLLNTVLWFFYSLIAILADDYLRYWLFGDEKPKYKIM